MQISVEQDGLSITVVGDDHGSLVDTVIRLLTERLGASGEQVRPTVRAVGFALPESDLWDEDEDGLQPPST